MTEYIYTPSENAFYAASLKSSYELCNTWPEDAIEIETHIANEFMGEPPEGKMRIAADDGLPCWVDVPEPTSEQLIQVAEQQKSALLAEAQNTISLWQTELQLGIISDDDKASLITWMKYIQALNAVDTSTAPDIEWPDKPE